MPPGAPRRPGHVPLERALSKLGLSSGSPFGGLELGDLEPGRGRAVTGEELRVAVPGAPVREK